MSSEAKHRKVPGSVKEAVHLLSGWRSLNARTFEDRATTLLDGLVSDLARRVTPDERAEIVRLMSGPLRYGDVQRIADEFRVSRSWLYRLARSECST